REGWISCGGRARAAQDAAAMDNGLEAWAGRALDRRRRVDVGVESRRTPRALCRTERTARPHASSGGRDCTPNQRLLSRKEESCDFDSAPTFVATTCPPRNSISVGMPRMPYFAGVDWFSSTFIFAMRTFPSYSRDTSSRIGAIILQGPHHSAQ